MPLTAGQSICTEADHASIYILLSGALTLKRPDSAEAASTANAAASNTIGVFETLDGGSMAWRATVSEAGSALRIDHDELFDLLADHVDLLQGIFSALIQSGTPAGVQAMGASGVR